MYININTTEHPMVIYALTGKGKIKQLRCQFDIPYIRTVEITDSFYTDLLNGRFWRVTGRTHYTWFIGLISGKPEWLPTLYLGSKLFSGLGMYLDYCIEIAIDGKNFKYAIYLWIKNKYTCPYNVISRYNFYNGKQRNVILLFLIYQAYHTNIDMSVKRCNVRDINLVKNMMRIIRNNLIYPCSPRLLNNIKHQLSSNIYHFKDTDNTALKVAKLINKIYDRAYALFFIKIEFR
jgi:hypothetical protein